MTQIHTMIPLRDRIAGMTRKRLGVIYSEKFLHPHLEAKRVVFVYINAQEQFPLGKQYLDFEKALVPHTLVDLYLVLPILPIVTKNINSDSSICCCSFLPELAFGRKPAIHWNESSKRLSIGAFFVIFCPFCGGKVPTSVMRKFIWSETDEEAISALWIGRNSAILMREARLRGLWAYETPRILTVRELLKDSEIDFLLDAEGTIEKLVFRFSPISGWHDRGQ